MDDQSLTMRLCVQQTNIAVPGSEPVIVVCRRPWTALHSGKQYIMGITAACDRDMLRSASLLTTPFV
jgi:hypothetical protein